MLIKILNESGYDEAILGLSLSYGTTTGRAKQVAEKLAFKDGGHNNFLELINVWIAINAPRYWWQQMDRYRCPGSQASESTMHTILNRELNEKDFEFVNGKQVVGQEEISKLNKLIASKKLNEVKALLPESYMQMRIRLFNYKGLRNIILQRYDHKLIEWQVFCKTVFDNISHKELLPNIKELYKER